MAATPLYSSGEFADLPFKESDTSLCTTGLFFMHKNRYENVLPPDTSRIILQDGNYINANMVDLGDGAPMIACQGPLSSTIEDFWGMVIQYQVTTILMVTPLIEKQKVKCVKYWPDSGKISCYGKINISNISSIHVSDNLVVSSLRISSDRTELSISHIHYSGMPDCGICDVSEVYLVLSILRSVMDDFLPFVCHCSAGIGRTGVFAAIIRCIRTGEPPVKAIRSIRNQRHGMVQNKKQFRLVREFMEFLDESRK
jgi:protein tyrosine phosphatase